MRQSLRRLVAAFLATLLSFACVSPATIARADEPEPALTEASAACLMDAHGNVLYERNSEEEMAMASITKVMTIMVALDSGIPLDTEITFVTSTYQDDAQLAGYVDGDVLTFGELLTVSLVFSGNDTASNVAYVVAGSEEAFAELMNAKAQEIGLEHTHFANAHGLEQEGHYSCAVDLCRMGQYAMEHYPFIRDTVKTRSLNVVTGGYEITLYSTDYLMDTYKGLLGIKTGRTESGHSFLGAARRDMVTLYSCVLCCDSSEGRFDDTATLLDWGFSQYQKRTLSRADWLLRMAPWEDGFWLRCPVSARKTAEGMVYPEGETTYTTVMFKPNTLIGSGDTYGTTVWTQGERLVGSVEYRASATTQSDAWNPFVLPLFEDTKGMTS